MNKVILIGRLVADPEIRENGDKKIARYRMAVDRRFNRGDQTADFISTVSFGKGAEFCEKYMRKGGKFAIEGRIQTGSYTKADGTKVYTTDVIAENQEFVESKGADREVNTQEPPIGEAPKISDEEFMSIPDGIDEQLPFH